MKEPSVNDSSKETPEKSLSSDGKWKHDRFGKEGNYPSHVNYHYSRRPPRNVDINRRYPPRSTARNDYPREVVREDKGNKNDHRFVLHNLNDNRIPRHSLSKRQPQSQSQSQQPQRQ